jgi:hypothetical protein
MPFRHKFANPICKVIIAGPEVMKSLFD